MQYNTSMTKKRKGTSKATRTEHFTEPFYRRVLYFVFGILLIALVFGLAYKFSQLDHVPIAESRSKLLFTMLLSFCGIGLVTTALRFRITTTPHSITVRRAFSTREMARRDIGAWDQSTFLSGGSNPVVFLYDHTRKRYRMRFPNIVEDDNAVSAWLCGIPYRAR